ncbi:MAG: hypothetical protein HOV87_29605 [Catenulispora sp.]|nr:hypothetical protein [Catenulispora sp.]
MFTQQEDQWSTMEMPRLNRAVLSGDVGPDTFAAEFSERVLADLPEPENLRPGEARRLLVVLGMSGSSIARHYQEQDLSLKSRPKECFARLGVGPGRTPFLTYFAGLAAATRTGHSARDSYASLVRWNLPTATVEADGQIIASLPGSFPDTLVRTYTGDPGEVAFFELLKKSEAYEAAANAALEPIADGSVDVLSKEAGDRAELATRLLVALHRINLDFATRAPEDGGLRIDHFMDVFRQFAVHWEQGDIPPSGAQDPEFLRRDLLMGIDFPGYEAHVRRLFPALLGAERDALERQMGRPTLPTVLLTALGLDPARLKRMTADELRPVVRDHPQLATWYLLLAANARIGAVHLMLTEKFLFKPQRARDASGEGDRPLVSNRQGTTGMKEPLLVRLARARRRYQLQSLGQISDNELARFAYGQAGTARARSDRLPTVRFIASDPDA